MSESKWGILFDYLDVKKDNILDMEEFMTLPNALIKSQFREIGESLKTLHEEYWQKMNQALDRPKSKPLFTKSEWIKATDVVAITPWYTQYFVPGVAKAYFLSVDLDHNGYITLDEWRKYQKLRGMEDEEVIQHTFSKLDQNGDGVVDPEEIRNAIYQFGVGGDEYNFVFAARVDIL